MLKAGADQDPVVTPEEDITKEVKAKIKEAKEDIKEVKEDIKEVKEEIKEVKAKIKKAEAMYSEEDLSKNPLYISHVNSLASLQSSLASLESRLTRYEARREGLETQAELLKEKNQLTAVPPAGATGGVGSAVAGGAWTGASSFYAPKILTVTIRRCSTSKGLRNGIFRICQDNYAAYCDSADQSFRWITPEHSFAGQRDLFVRVRTMNLRYAVSIQRTIEELCGYRQFEAEFSMEPDLDTSEPIFVSVQHFRSSGISPEYSPTPSVGSSSKVTNVSEEKQLRMIEDPGYSHLRIGGLQQCHLLPRYRYQKYVRHPMNIIFLSAALHGALDSSESRTRSRGRSVAVPTICFSLAKDEFRDEYANRVVTKEYGGVEEEMVEVFLAVLFRVTNHEYMSHMLAMLKTGSVQRGDVLITSVFLRRQYESTKDFEFFVRGNKTYSVNLWRKVSETDQTEYYLQEEDFRDIEDENDEAVVGQETYSP